MTDSEMLKATYDRMLAVFESVGGLSREVAEVRAELAEHRAEDREAVAQLRLEIRTLRGTGREMRKMVSSLSDDVEATGKHIVFGRRKWDSTWRWVIRSIVAAFAATVTAVVTWYFSTKGK